MCVSVSPVLLTLVRTPCGRRELWVSLIGCGLPTRSNLPAAAAQVRRMKQATVEVKSPTSMVWKRDRANIVLENILHSQDQSGCWIKGGFVSAQYWKWNCVFAPYLNSYTSGGYDLLDSDGRALRQRHLSVGGLLWSSTKGQLSATPSSVTKRTRWQRLAIPDDIIIQRCRHALANQKKPANTADWVWSLTWYVAQNIYPCVSVFERGILHLASWRQIE